MYQVVRNLIKIKIITKLYVLINLQLGFNIIVVTRNNRQEFVTL